VLGRARLSLGRPEFFDPVTRATATGQGVMVIPPRFSKNYYCRYCPTYWLPRLDVITQRLTVAGVYCYICSYNRTGELT
jgi:hypothetical protein